MRQHAGFDLARLDLVERRRVMCAGICDALQILSGLILF